MRIISGSRRGHKLFEFNGRYIRPTTDRVKEAIFSMIAGYIPDASVLDMFSGSGALSFEMISRGAGRAVLIDSDKSSVAVIKRNIDALGFGESCEVVNASCFDWLRGRRERFDVIFLDPPYNKGLVEQALGAIAKSGVLADDGIIVLESDNTDFRSDYPGLEVWKQKRYGRTYITIYKKEYNK